MSSNEGQGGSKKSGVFGGFFKRGTNTSTSSSSSEDPKPKASVQSVQIRPSTQSIAAVRPSNHSLNVKPPEGKGNRLSLEEDEAPTTDLVLQDAAAASLRGRRASFSPSVGHPVLSSPDYVDPKHIRRSSAASSGSGGSRRDSLFKDAEDRKHSSIRIPHRGSQGGEASGGHQNRRSTAAFESTVAKEVARLKFGDVVTLGEAQEAQEQQESRAAASFARMESMSNTDVMNRRGLGSGSSLIHPLGHALLKGTKSTLSTRFKETLCATCTPRLLCSRRSPGADFAHNANRLNAFLDKFQDEWRDLFTLFQWPQLPSRQHEKMTEFNYLTHLIWILSYGAGRAYGPEDDKETYYRDLYEALLLAGEEAGILVQEFVDPFMGLQKVFSELEELASMFELELYKPIYYGLTASEIFTESLIPKVKKYKIRDYLKLGIFTRDLASVHWTEFWDLPYPEQMARIVSGMKNVVENLQKLNTRLPYMLKKVRIMTDPKEKIKWTESTRPLRLLERMRAICTDADIMSTTTPEDQKLIQNNLYLVARNLMYLIEQGIYFTINMWEILLITRLSYTYIQSAPNACGKMKPLDEVVKRLGEAKEKDRLQPFMGYKWRQFYDVNCPSLLRRIPVFVDKKVEMAIHLENFINKGYGHFGHRSVLATQRPSVATSHLKLAPDPGGKGGKKDKKKGSKSNKASSTAKKGSGSDSGDALNKETK